MPGHPHTPAFEEPPSPPHPYDAYEYRGLPSRQTVFIVLGGSVLLIGVVLAILIGLANSLSLRNHQCPCAPRSATHNI